MIYILLIILFFIGLLLINIYISRKTRKPSAENKTVRIQNSSENILSEKALIELVESIVAKKNHNLTAKTSLFEMGYLDSMAMIQLATELEKKYSFEFATSDISIQNFQTIENIQNLLINKYKCRSDSQNTNPKVPKGE